MSEPLNPSDTPLASVDPDSVTALFLADPATHSEQRLNDLIGELRRRADVHRAEAAAEAAKPKTASGRKRKPNELIDAAMAATADKPVSELSAADLFGPNGD